MTPGPFRPVLRAKLLTGERPLYLRATLVAGRATRSSASELRPWEVDEKLFGTYRSLYLDGQVSELAAASLP